MLNGKIVAAVIPAAGSGRRMGGVAKQFLEFQGKPLLYYSLQVFQRSPLIDRIVIVGPEDGLTTIRSLVGEHGIAKVTAVVAGGEHRQDSVLNGVTALPPEEVGIIVVHDAARPFLTDALLEEVLRAAEKTGGAIAAAPTTDTVKRVDAAMMIQQTLDRETIWLAQTPQAFRTEVLLDAFKTAKAASFIGTDEASLLERAGFPVTVIRSTKENLKITTTEDLESLKLLNNRGF